MATAIASQSESDPPPKIPPPNPTSDDASDASAAATAAATATPILTKKGGNANAKSKSLSASPLSASLVEQRRGFTKKQNLRRRVYRDLTVFRMFPLQAMAVDDYDVQMMDYLDVGGSDGYGDGSVHASADGSKSASTKTASSHANLIPALKDDEDDLLREQYQREFLKERSIPTSKLGADRCAIRGQAGNGNAAQKHNGDDSTSTSSPADEGEGKTTSSEGKVTTSQKCDETSDANSGQLKLKDQVQVKQQNEQKQQQQQSFQSSLWSMEPRIFACETAIKGKRRYISAHLGRFMDHYWRECDVHSRHYYELIKEDTPCRLYFDLEFIKHANPNLTPTITEDLLTQLFDELRIQFQRIYSISIKRSDMVDLDSSTSKKFSRHWILHLPDGELFSDAREVGVFVKVFVSRLEEEKESEELQSRGHELLADNLSVNAEGASEEGNTTPKLTRFIDLGVYTRNRIFRIMGSTKFGKPADAALRIAEANEFPFPDAFGNAKFYLPETSKAVLDSKKEVVNDGANITVNSQDDDFLSFCNSLSWEDHAAAMAATLIVPANAGKMNYPTLIDPSNLLTDDDKQQMTLLRSLNNMSGTGGTSKFPRAALSYGSSPFPKLEHFVVNILGKREGLVGMVGTWSLGTQQPLPQIICFNMKDNRFCENIGRPHKSNNIIWNCHLVDRICWQGCHDPECRGFRGKSIDLPEEIDSEIDEYFLDYELSSLNENEIIANKTHVQAEPRGDGEFDDPALEAAMIEFDISTAAQEKDAESAFDDELAKINLSDIISNNCEKSGPLSDKENASGKIPNQAGKSTASESACENDTVKLSEPWDNDSTLDSELAKLSLADILSS